MRIILRADGNSNIGLGHVMRLLALAEMLKPDFTCVFAIQEPTPTVGDLISARGIEIIVLPAESDYQQEASRMNENILKLQDVLVLDGYYFNTAYQESLRQQVVKLFCLDDIHTFPFVADVVINPAGGVDTRQYQLAPHTQLLTGPDYALLREPFLIAAQQHRRVNKLERLFVNMGGADPQNHTLAVLQQLQQLGKEFQLDVVVGSAYQKCAEVLDFLNQSPKLRVQVHQNLTAEAMCRLMQHCDASICPPSTVAYEWCTVSGPLFILRTADNQKHLEHFLIKENLAFPYQQLPELLDTPNTAELFSGQIQQQRLYFYGQSRQKWRQLFFTSVYPEWLRFRRAVASDSMLLFEWTNDPDVRKYSLNPLPIPLEVHLGWFEKKVEDKNSFIFIAEIGSQPVGMIRFDVSDADALISYLLAKEFRGKGLGTAMLTRGIQAFINNQGQANKVVGLVQKQNIASVRAFEKAGFTLETYTNSLHPNLLKFTKVLQAFSTA